jgi:Ca2+-binding RTX toxin-like protein
MDGGAGNDVFVFHRGFGRDTIRGFDSDPVGGQDKLDVLALLAEGVETIAITASGRNTVIAFGDDVITLEGVNVRTISEADFLI